MGSAKAKQRSGKKQAQELKKWAEFWCLLTSYGHSPHLRPKSTLANIKAVSDSCIETITKADTCRF
jgi:hypothetical protein